jgi:DNA repair exonuclease SbcCD ATPase subunit
MQELNVNPFDGPDGPVEGNGPKGQKIDMKQTDFETSDAKRELVESDEKLGREIDEKSAELSKSISEVEKDAKKNIDEVKSGLSDKLKDVQKDLSDSVKAIDAVTGVDTSALPERLRLIKEEFVTLQAEWTKTVQGIEDPENMTEQEVIATNALKYYGWDFSTPGFLSYLDRGTEAFFGSIDTEQYKEYEKYVEGLNTSFDENSSEMDEVQNDIDAIEAIENPTEEDLAELKSLKGEMDELKAHSSEIHASLKRITDVDPLSGKHGVADQDGCRQWLWDNASSDEKEFRSKLANELVGYGAKAGYYKDLEAEFRAEAETWKIVKAQIADKEANGEELTPKEEAQKFASENFEQKYGFEHHIIAVLTWNEGNDDALGFVVASDNGIYEEYQRYFEQLITSIDEKSSEIDEVQNDIDAIEAIENPTEEDLVELEALKAEMDHKTAELADSNDKLKRISSPDDVDSNVRVKSQAGSFAYYSDNKEREFKNFKEELATEIVGYGAKAGYYKNLEAEFRAEAETWKTVKESIAKKLEAGEELTPKEDAQKFASDNFEQKYGFTAHAFAVLTWNEGNDDNKGFVEAADNGIYEEYSRYFEQLNTSIDENSSEMESLQNEIDAIEAIESPTEEDLAELDALRVEMDHRKAELADLNDILKRISSPDHVDSNVRVKSQAGSFAYYSDMEDASDKSYREATSEMIGFEKPSEELESIKKDLESRIKHSVEILEDSENYEPEVVKAAKDFIAAVGSKVTVVSLGKFQNVVHEEEKAVQETEEAIRLAETFNSMANEIAAQAKVYSFRNLDVYPLPNGEAVEFTIENPEGLTFEILNVTVNGIQQTEGEEVIFNNSTIQMAPGILLERGDELRVVAKVESEIEIKPVDPKFGEYDFPGESTCIVRGAISKSMESGVGSLKDSEKDLTKDSVGFSARSEFYTSELLTFEDSMATDKQSVETKTAESDKMGNEITTITEVIDTTTDQIDDTESRLQDNYNAISNNSNLINSHKSQILANKEVIKELEADPYPDTVRIDQLNELIKTMETDIAEAEKDTSMLEDTNKDLEDELMTLRQVLKDSESNRDGLLTAVAKLSSEIEVLDANIEYYGKVTRVIAMRQKVYSDKIKETSEAIEMLKVRIAELEKSITDYTQESIRLGCGGEA